MKVEEVMKPARGCHAGDSVRDCAKLMKERNIGFVPICDESDQAIGTLTDRDLAIRVLADGRSPDAKVDDVMTRDLVTCRVGDDLQDAERLMREHRKSRIMICDEAGKLVGVLSLSDVIDLESEGDAANTLREIAARENQQPNAS